MFDKALIQFCRDQNCIVLPNYIVNESLYTGSCGIEKLDHLKIVLVKVVWVGQGKARSR